MKNCGTDDVCTSELDLTVTVHNLPRCVLPYFFLDNNNYNGYAVRPI